MLPSLVDGGVAYEAEYPHGLAVYLTAQRHRVPYLLLTDSYHHNPGIVEFASKCVRALGDELLDLCRKDLPEFWNALAAVIHKRFDVTTSYGMRHYLPQDLFRPAYQEPRGLSQKKVSIVQPTENRR